MTAFNIVLLIFLFCLIPFFMGAFLLTIMALFDDGDTQVELDSDLEDFDLEYF